jgi:hypothetical protein
MPQDSQDLNQDKAKTTAHKIRERFFGSVSDPQEAPQSQVQILVPAAAERVEPPTKEIRDSLASLPHHPGFAWLMKKFAFQRTVLDSTLRSQKHADLRAVDALQNLSFALNWVQAQVDQETGRQKPETRPTTSYETELFEKVKANINVLTD